MFSRFDRMLVSRVWQTGRPTDSPRYAYASRGKRPKSIDKSRTVADINCDVLTRLATPVVTKIKKASEVAVWGKFPYYVDADPVLTRSRRIKYMVSYDPSSFLAWHAIRSNMSTSHSSNQTFLQHNIAKKQTQALGSWHLCVHVCDRFPVPDSSDL